MILVLNYHHAIFIIRDEPLYLGDEFLIVKNDNPTEIWDGLGKRKRMKLLWYYLNPLRDHGFKRAINSIQEIYDDGTDYSNSIDQIYNYKK